MTSHGQIPALNHGQIFLYLRNPMGKSWANFQIGQKNRSYLLCNSLIFRSGQKDSNLRPPAPKAGALAGLRHTPKKKTMQHRLLSVAEKGGFEPPVPLAGYDSLANCWFQPLTHLSRCRIATAKIGLLQLTATFFSKKNEKKHNSMIISVLKQHFRRLSWPLKSACCGYHQQSIVWIPPIRDTNAGGHPEYTTPHGTRF